MKRPLPDRECIKDLVFLLVHVRPQLTAERIWEDWEIDPILREYRRPALTELRVWCREFHEV